jgi:hypothetical protein
MYTSEVHLDSTEYKTVNYVLLQRATRLLALSTNAADNSTGTM